jgi:Tfp pilus assembly major pilin PilA
MDDLVERYMNIRKQSGWTMWTLMFTLFVIGSIAWIGLKLVPLYLDNGTIQSVLKTISQDRAVAESSYGEIDSRIRKTLSINSIRWVQSKDIEFVDGNGYTEVRIDYEKRIPMVANIDVIVTFKNGAKLPN